VACKTPELISEFCARNDRQAMEFKSFHAQGSPDVTEDVFVTMSQTPVYVRPILSNI
jgi:hypothetical protein